MVDTLEEWEDYAPFAAIRSAPARYGLVTTRHTVATCRMRGAGTAGGGRWQIQNTWRHQWKGMDFATQAESIRKLTKNITLNTSGLMPPASVSVCPARALVLSRRARYPLHAGNETAMVLKAKDVIRRGCLEYDAAPPTSPARLWLSARP